MKKSLAIILAAGSGKRMGLHQKKQFLSLAEKPLFIHSLEVLEEADIDDMMLVIGKEDAAEIKEILSAYTFTKLRAIVYGGAERYLSVYEALKQSEGYAKVLIHDSARPLLNTALVSRVVNALEKEPAVVPVVAVKDTIRMATADMYSKETPDRRTLFAIQTPQGFHYRKLKSAYEELMKDEKLQDGITDDAMVLERVYDIKAKFVDGDYRNIKITTIEDLAIAQALVQMQKREV